MPRYELFHPDTEILGQVLLDLEQAIGSENFAPVLAQHGLTGLEPDLWYPAQPWVDVLNEIGENSSAMMDFVSMGIRQMELVQWPPEFDDMTISEILGVLDDVYRENYRGTDIGYLRMEQVGPKHVVLIVRSFEPDSLWYGNLYGIAKRFVPEGMGFDVYFDEEQPRREEGGEETILHLEWD